MTYSLIKRLTSASIAGVALLGLAACEDPIDRPPMESEQIGYRGTGMAVVKNPRLQEIMAQMNEVPDQIYPPAEVTDESPMATEVYENVQVLTNLTSDQFDRLMAHITEWVAPAEEGCAYCHNLEEGFAWDGVYTKIVARKMIQMTWQVNEQWSDHVGNVGVTCYTCHRGNPLPNEYWFTEAENELDGTALGYEAGQNHPTPAAGLSTLANDPFTRYLLDDQEIRVIGNTALPIDGYQSNIKETEYTYGLMMHFSQGLGVNCTFCHNSRAFSSWEESPPQRATAWYAIRMARDINNNYMVPLTDVFPENNPAWPGQRLGETGDVGKVNCATCHNGVNKPLYGTPMVHDYPELWGGRTFDTGSGATAEADAPASQAVSAGGGGQ